jgi:hypothetical protein
MVFGQTDQNGQYGSDTLPPGPYFVLLFRTAASSSADGVQRLWRSRSTYGTAVEIAPAASLQLRLPVAK